MSSNILDRLMADELLANAGAFSTAASLRQFFGHASEVHEIRKALRQGMLTEDSIQAFATTLLAELRKGVLFKHDLTLAALAVVLEGQATPFAEEFLRNFAGLSLAEMPLGPRVAREVLKQRASLAVNQAVGARPSAQPVQAIGQTHTEKEVT
jgi:hypothetical protein